MKLNKYIKIPKIRIAVLIGKNGTTKKYIEEKSQTFLKIDSKGGIVEILTKSDVENVLSFWKTAEVIKAIARGFSPKRAYKLFEENIYMEIIDLEETLNTDKKIKRIKGRIIGEQGKSRIMIEEMTDAYISVFGNTVSIIGEHLPFKIAKKAVNKLISGDSHTRVYRFLQKNFKKIQDNKYSLWKTIPEVRDDFEFQ